MRKNVPGEQRFFESQILNSCGFESQSLRSFGYMLRSFLSFAVIVLLLAALFVMPPSVEARRCGEKPPESLLSLYRNSTAIYVSRFDRIDDFAVIEDEKEYSVVDIRKHFNVSTTLKGEARKFVVVEEQEYRSKEIQSEEPESEEQLPAETETPETDVETETGDEEFFGPPKLEPGDEVLVFVKNGETEGSVVLTDYRDGVKKLDPEAMAAYVQRIKELNSIFASQKIDDAEIVAWLVRATEDPITRWEGAYELNSAFEMFERKEKRAAIVKEKTDRGEKLEDWEIESEEGGEGDEAEVDTSKYARLLTDGQKQRLLNVLLEQKPADDGSEGEIKLRKMSEGDRILLELVARWGDDRLAVFLLEQLKANPDVPYLNSQLMEKIALVLDDKMVKDLAERYGSIYYEDNEEITDDDVEIAVNQKDDTNEPELPEAGEPAKAADGDTESREPKVKRKTYGELRAELMSAFVLRSEQVVADPERQLAAK